MTLGIDPDTRTLEVLRAIANGAKLVSDILPHSSYVSASNVRRICARMRASGLLIANMKVTRRSSRALSQWPHGPLSYHFELTGLGLERLAELEERANPEVRARA